MKRWLKYALLGGLVLWGHSSAFAQAGFISGVAQRYTPAGAFPAGGATVTICTSAGAGTPCTPKVSLFSDSGLSVSATNPLTACTTSPQVGCIDAFGNFTAYVAIGAYTYTVTGAGLTAYGPLPIIAVAWTGGTTANSLLGPGSISGTFSGAFTLSGTPTFANNVNPSPLNAAGANIGTASLPWVALFLGSDSTTSNELTSGATTGHSDVNTLPDATGTLLQTVTPEGGGPAGAANQDDLWADLTAHRWKMNNNNAGADTVVGAATTDTLTNKTLTAPVINGTPTGTGIPTLTLKKGSGGGNYTSASTTYAVVDSTNLCYTVTIPTGWKLSVMATGAIGTATAAVQAQTTLTDNAACGTANSGLLIETTETTTAAGMLQPFALTWVISGDGAAHNIALQYKTANGADSVTILNSSATQVPAMTFNLTPSN